MRLGPIAEGVLRARVPIVLALVALTAVMTWGLVQVRFDFSPQAFFRTGDANDQFLEVMADDFGPSDNTMLVVVRHPDGVLQRPVLEWIDDLTTRLGDAEWAERVTGPTSVALVVPPEDAFADIRVEAPGVTLTEAQVAGDPLVDGLLVNRDRTGAAILIDIDREITRIRDIKPRMRALDALLDAKAPPPGTEVIPYGLPYLRAEVIEMMRGDQLIRFPIAAAIFLLILLAIVRGRTVAAVIPFAAIVGAIVWVAGLLGFADQPINLLTNVLPVMLLTIGISDSIHLLTRYAEESIRRDKHQALVHTTARLGAACFLTSFTTATGFASLLVARTEILAEFGLLSAIGVVFAYITTILGIPTVLSWFRPLEGLDADGQGLAATLARMTSRVGDMVVGHPGRSLLFGLAITVTMLVGASQVVVDTRVHEGFDPETDLYARQMLAERTLGGLLPLEISVRGVEGAPQDALRRADILRRVWALHQYVAEQPGVGPPISPSVLVRALWLAVEGAQPEPDDPTQTPNLPTNDEQLAQLLLLGSTGGEELPFDQVVTSDWRHLRILARIEDRGTNHYRPIFDRIQARADALFADVPGVEVRLTGNGYTATTALSYFVDDLLSSLGLAALIIFLTMTVLFRSVKEGLISVVPNAFPLLCTFGYMGYAGIPLNTGTVITFAVSLGIAVDDTIHFLTRFNEEHSRHPVPVAVRRTMRHGGAPIVTTTLLICIGFSVLTTSEFLVTQQFAQLIMIAMLAALPGDLVILPALLTLFGGRKDTHTTEV